MKILVFGGSPKGETSVTQQYVRYLAKALPGTEVAVLQPAADVKKLEKDPALWDSLLAEAAGADLVLWAFPLYVFTVCSQYKRFIELLFERGGEQVLRGKYAASLTTSIHFFDHTAHAYIQAVSEDLGLVFAGSFSAEMNDLLKPSGRRALELFGLSLLRAVEEKFDQPRAFPALRHEARPYLPGPASVPNLRPPIETEKRIVVLTDSEEGNVGALIRRFQGNFRKAPEVVNLAKLRILGGCLGCLRCGQANVCAYEGKDEFIGMYREKLATADVLVFAGAIRDRYLSSLWKLFFDRAFFNTHQQSLRGKRFGFLISGPFGQIPNLREILSAFAEWQGSDVTDFVTDEAETASEIDAGIDGLARRLAWAAEVGYQKPATFLGVAGMKIFRDEIYGDLRIVFKADHRAYKREGVYNFPQRRRFRMLLIRLGYAITSVPFIYRKIAGNFRTFMLKPYEHLFAGERKS